jgi:hypothetical protein
MPNAYSTANSARKTQRSSQSTNDHPQLTSRSNSLIGRMLSRTTLSDTPPFAQEVWQCIEDETSGPER